MKHTVDPLEVSAVQAAWWTFYATCGGILIATAAAVIALWDLLQNTAQFRDFTRRPDFKVGVRAFRTAFTIGGVSQPTITFDLRAKNIGERLTKQIRAELLIPVEVLVTAPNPDDESVRRVNGSDYVVHASYFEHIVYPFAPPSSFLTNRAIGVKSDTVSFVALWRFYDEYGNYPKNDYGRIQLPNDGWSDIERRNGANEVSASEAYFW